MVGRIRCNSYQLRICQELSETSFTKLFLCMEKFKKSAAGHAAIWLLLSGELEIKDSDLNARTVEYSSPVTIRGSDWKTGLSGLKNGCSNAKLLRRLAGIAVYQ